MLFSGSHCRLGLSVADHKRPAQLGSRDVISSLLYSHFPNKKVICETNLHVVGAVFLPASANIFTSCLLTFNIKDWIAMLIGVYVQVQLSNSFSCIGTDPLCYHCQRLMIESMWETTLEQFYQA